LCTQPNAGDFPVSLLYLGENIQEYRCQSGQFDQKQHKNPTNCFYAYDWTWVLNIPASIECTSPKGHTKGFGMSGFDLNNYLPADMVKSIDAMAASPNVPQTASNAVTNAAASAAPSATPTAAASVAPAATPSMPAAPSGLPGVDPSLQARIVQSLQNPNAGDAFTMPAMAAANTAAPPTEGLLPGSPQDMLMGAAVGTGFGLGMTAISQRGGFERLAAAVDKLPGVRQVSAAMDKRLASTKSAGIREWAMRDAMEKGSSTAISNMEKRQLSMMAGGYSKIPEVQSFLSKQKTFAGAQTGLEQKITALENKTGKLTKEETRLLRAYRGASQSIKGIGGMSYSPLFAQQAAQSERLAAKGVGSVGRGVAGLSLYTQRIFGGDTLNSMMGGKLGKTAEQGADKLFSMGKIFPAALGGAFIFGSAISKARKAKDGEKTSTFMHDFLGVGIGSMVGWEVGQKVLTAIGFRGMMDKVGNKIGLGNISNRLLTPGRGLLEKFMSPATVTKITKFLPKLTLGGTAVGLIGMFVFGGLFQKVFEKASDSIFGKPSEDPNAQGGTAAQQAALAGSTNSVFSGFQQPTAASSTGLNTASAVNNAAAFQQFGS
jgi:hypothetical protein